MVNLDDAHSGLVFPDYGLRSLLSVLPGVASSLGLAGTTTTGLSYLACQEALHLPAATNVVVVMCDGLGYLNLEANRAYAPFLRARFSGIEALTSTFPSTTAAALTGFGTGAPPGQTCMVGYTVRVPQSGYQTKGGVGILANLVAWTQQRDPSVIAGEKGNQGAAAFGVAPEEFQRVPASLSAMEHAGVSVLTTGPSKFAGSGLTKAAFDAGRFHADQGLGGRVDAVISFIRKPIAISDAKAAAARSTMVGAGSASGVAGAVGRVETPAKLAYLYWGDVDKAGHGDGPDSVQWTEALAHFDHELERLVRGLPPDTLVVMTADHGQLAVSQDSQIDVAAVPELRRGVALVGGEARMLHVYAFEPPTVPPSGSALYHQDTGAEIAERWRDYLGDWALVWTRAEAIAAGLFGTVQPHVKPWIGDVVVACTGNTTIVDSRTQTAHSLELKGMHGSLTPVEMLVPLLVEVTP